MQRDDRKNPGKLTNGHGGNGASHPALVGPLEPRFVIEQGPAAPPQPTDNSVLIRGILAAFRRRWLLATSLGLTCAAAAAAAAWFLIPAPYTAFGEVRIFAQRPRLVFTEDERTNFGVYKGTQARLLMGYFTLQAALRDSEAANASLIRDQLHPIDWLERNLKVSSPSHEFLRVSLSGENPRELANVVNAVLKAYMQEVVGEEELARRERLTSLDNLYVKLHGEIEDVRRQRRLQAEAANVSTSDAGSKKQEHLYDRALVLRQAYAQVDMDLLRARVNLAAKEEVQQDPESIEFPDHLLEAELIQIPEFQQAAGRLAQAEHNFEKAQVRLIPGAPALASMESNLATAREALSKLREELLPVARTRIIESMEAQQQASSTELRSQIALLEAKQKQLQHEIDQIKSEEIATGAVSLNLEEYELDLERKEKIAAAIFDRKQRLEIELDSPIGIELYREALPPHTRDIKKKVTGTAGAGFGMLGLIVGGIVLLELRARRISSLDQVAGGLNVRILGSVPAMPRSVTTATNGKKKARNAFWNSLLGESIDATRTMLLREARDAGRNVVMVASAMGGEGKTSLCCHLATSLAKARRRVLLVDGDLRRPTVHRVFGLPQGPGVCEVLRGEAKLEEVVQTLKSGLSILPAGKISQDVLQILAQDGMEAILKELRQQYDFVLLDSSPVLPVTDSLLVAQHVDGIIFAIRRDVSRAAKVAAAMQRMEMLGVPLLGAVVIGLDDETGGFGYGSRYNYGYAYGARNPYHSALPAR